MTRLRDDWLKTIESDLPAYESALRRKTGLNFVGIAAKANNLACETVLEKAAAYTIAVIPVTAGLGAIGGFSSAVAAIIRQAGFRAFETQATDVGGLYEAYSKGARLAFMADDRRFIGFDLERRRVSDNNAATARGFMTALEAMCPGGLAGKEVLVLGCGVIGKLAAAALIEKGAFPHFYDKTLTVKKTDGLFEAAWVSNPADIARYPYIMDATSEGGWLKSDMIHNEAVIAAPGVPLSLDADALARHGERLVHDVLQIGTLTMLGELLV